MIIIIVIQILLVLDLLSAITTTTDKQVMYRPKQLENLMCRSYYKKLKDYLVCTVVNLIMVITSIDINFHYHHYQHH